MKVNRYFKMKLLYVFLGVLCLGLSATARPRYVAVPIEDVQFLDYAPNTHVRLARQAYNPPQPIYIPAVDAEAASSEGRHARQSGHHADPHDYVDFGAHTGHHGAFGWYADFPVHAHDH